MMVNKWSIWRLQQFYIDKVPTEAAKHGLTHYYLIIAGAELETSSKPVTVLPISKHKSSDLFCEEILKKDFPSMLEYESYIWCHYPSTMPAKFFENGWLLDIDKSNTIIGSVNSRLATYLDLAD